MSIQPAFITFTGIDDRTDLTVADRLASQYPIEWGVLFSSNNRDARFPSTQAVMEILSISGMKSAHICGAFSKQAQSGAIPEGVPLLEFDRVQINGFNLDQTYFNDIEEQYGVQVIKQMRSESFDVDSKHLQLYDCSGGAGILPVSVPKLGGQDRLVGYAGGIGPDSVLHYLEMIEGVGKFWIDMEGRVRTDGWFDVRKAAQVCEAVFGQ